MDKQEWKKVLTEMGGRLYTSSVYSIEDPNEYLYGTFDDLKTRNKFSKMLRSDNWKVKSETVRCMGYTKYQFDAKRLKSL